LKSRSAAVSPHRVAGFIEGQSVAVEYRFADGQFDRLPALATDLVRNQVALLVASSNPGAFAAKQATATIPIVFAVGDDPVTTGLVASLNRPGGNMTGVYLLTLEAKRLGLLHELVPRATTIAALMNDNYPPAETQLRDLREAAPRVVRRSKKAKKRKKMSGRK
jgi:putative tryptophan/tyrosine transport system substrate-binding protein